MSARAECTWGEGPDVMVIVERVNLSGFGWTQHGDDAGSLGSFGLTAGEARRLAAELIMGAERSEELDRSFDDAMKQSPP